ncbi:MAG: SdpI family protein [Lachnospiraceae bacterium]|jgi:uncharacterized membrane protein|nr:SdpI family protein [Lachnospiraceae bacterium]MBQ4304267.1 SdpI family protein [Lachnospiraceae bacterium]MBQ5359729.1 SdpI family protein [Lachnospiraceae bacterium]
MNGSFFNLIMTMLIPLIMVVCGWLFMHGIPKDRNSLFGYRTAMSVKNDDTWRFAHEYCGRLWLIIGLVLFAVTTVFMVLSMNMDPERVAFISGILMMIYVVPLLATVAATESAMKKTFDTRGKRKK